jgi:CubicO group peptidase (beta-lactamase class C family)
VIRSALREDPVRLGGDLEQFTQRYLFAPMGMRDARWSEGEPDKARPAGTTTTLPT